MFTLARREWEEFSASSPYKTAKNVKETGSYALSAAKLAGGAALYSNPITAGLAVASEVDKWLGRAIGWVQMAKKEWDADCSRITVRVAKLIKETHTQSKLSTAQQGSENSTLTRQRYEKLLYKQAFKIREQTIKYKIRECEVTAEAQKILEQKRVLEQQIHSLSQLDSSSNDPNAKKLETRVRELTQKGEKLSNKIMDLLNEVVANTSRLVNQAQVNVERMVQDLVQSYKDWLAKGKFTGAHQGAWHDSIRRLF